MPRGDGTGPMGQGPMTGHAGGYCAGFSTPGFLNPVAGNRGFHAGRGGGGRRGRRNQFHATGLTGWQRAAMEMPVATPEAFAAPMSRSFAPSVTKEQEANMLENQAEYFENVLQGIKKRLDEIKVEPEE